MSRLLRRSLLCVLVLAPHGDSSDAEALEQSPDDSLKRTVSRRIAPTLQVSDEHVVSLDGPLVEPHLATDPERPHSLLLGAIRPLSPTLWRVDVWRSDDAGSQWTSVPLPGRDTTRLSGDPWVGFAPDGRAYVTHLARLRIDERRTRVGVMMHRSVDRGRSFILAAPVPFGDGLSFDHPTFDVDWSAGPTRGTVHLAASQGAWTPARNAVYRIGTTRWRADAPAPDTATGFLYNNFNQVNGDVTILDDGTVIYPYFEISRIVDNRDQMLAHKRLWVVRSHDAGRTFANPFLVAEDFMGQFPRLAVDRSGTTRGRLYMVWRGTERDTAVYLSVSDSKGELWSPATRVSAGAWRSDAKWRTPSIAVNPDGLVAISWYAQEGAVDLGCYRVYVTISRDGGASFSEAAAVSSRMSCPRTAANIVGPDSARLDAARRWPGGGDYGALASAADGSFHVVWADARDGRFHLRHAVVTP